MTTLELQNYYADLLILQYKGKPKAYATIQNIVSQILMPQTSTQTIAFSSVPDSGTFQLSYNGLLTSVLNDNDSTATIQSALRALTGLGSVLVTGDIATQLLTVTFVNVIPPALLIEVVNSSLQTAGSDVTVTVTETDLTLPLAVQNAFNMIGSDIARGVNLDVLGKYQGVSRTGNGINGVITLGDDDFYTLIRFATITNNSGSSLAEIQSLLFQFFGNNILLYDLKNMSMSYFINSMSFTNPDLVQLLITDQLLPKPMGVGLTIIYGPDTENFFGFRTYGSPAIFSKPFNTYDNYHMDWPFLSYQDIFMPLVSLATEAGDTIIQENGDFMYKG